MRNRIFRLPARAVVTMAALTLSSAALVSCGDDGDSDATADTDATDATYNDADVQFAQGMIPHHAQAVEMSQLVPDRSELAEVRGLAEDIEAAQQPEIDLMTRMLEDWGQEAPADDEDPHAGHSGSDDMAGMMSDDDMAGLEAATGAELDEMWLTMMIEHHEGAISMSQGLLEDGVDPEAADLAEEIIEAQQAEIDQMRQLLDEVPS